jgi:hypothetical protein
MKVFFAITALFASSLMFTSCSKDDAPDSLVGTSWISFGDRGSTITFSFPTSSTVDIVYKESNGKVTSFRDSYTYSKPKVTIDSDGYKVYGTIKGNELTIEIDGNKYLFTRK